MNCSRWHYGIAAALVFAIWTALAAAARADNAPLRPPEAALLEGVRLVQRLDAQVPFDAPLRDERGAPTSLRDCAEGRPVILSLVDFQCPMLCTEVLNGLLVALRGLDFDAGQQFEVVALSFRAEESTELAARKKAAYLGGYQRAGANDGWHFLTGDGRTVRRIADSVGFSYKYDPKSDQFAHPSGILLLTPDGRVARYFYGIDYSTRDLRLGLVETSARRIGSPVDEFLLLCFHYDPRTGRYGLAVFAVLRAAAVATVALLAAGILVLSRRGRRAARSLEGSGRADGQVAATHP